MKPTQTHPKEPKIETEKHRYEQTNGEKLYFLFLMPAAFPIEFLNLIFLYSRIQLDGNLCTGVHIRSPAIFHLTIPHALNSRSGKSENFIVFLGLTFGPVSTRDKIANIMKFLPFRRL